MKPFPNIPKHIAIIMDGDRRWARAHGLPVYEGHRRVVNTVLEPLIDHAASCGVRYLTFWAWSTENWQRDRREVTAMMRLFRYMIRKRWNRLHRKGVRIRTIGDLSKFDPDIRSSLADVVEQTKNNTTITVVFALNYGGRDELLRAINKAISYQLSAIRQKTTEGPNTPADDWKLTIESFSDYLDTSGIPDPELIIRTSGEERMSGFLPWQSEYSEFYFPRWHMPEFTPERLDEAIAEYGRRKRRFGK